MLSSSLHSFPQSRNTIISKLKPDARPVQNPDDPLTISSAADCRLTVYTTVDLAKQFWIKGNNFTIPNLLGVAPDSEHAKLFEDGGLASFRLAPADYHRFHSPIDGTVGDIKDIPGQYYTVNPQAVNESGFDVLTENKRSVLYLTHTPSNLPVAFVAIGAMLVGSIKWTKGSEKDATVKRGEELGYFAYGGSTVVVLFPKALVEFDEDLVASSKEGIETLMKVCACVVWVARSCNDFHLVSGRIFGWEGEDPFSSDLSQTLATFCLPDHTSYLRVILYWSLSEPDERVEDAQTVQLIEKVPTPIH